MARHRSRRVERAEERASQKDAAHLRSQSQAHRQRDGAAVRPVPDVAVPADEDAAARAAQQAAVEKALSQQRVRRRARTAGAMGPIGRSVLLVAVLALAGLVAIWLLLAV